jgi:threonine dehydratase
LGIDATIVLPTTTPRVKVDAIKRFEAKIVMHGERYMDSEKEARSIERCQGKTFVSAYNDPEVIGGQGTVGLEMIEDEPSIDTVLVPVGGGGLISGVARVFKEVSDAEVIGVQSRASPVMYESIKTGEIVDMELEDSIAEGLHGGIEKGSVTFDLCKEAVDDFIIVEEEAILEAVRLMLFKHRMIVEGSGAVGIAAIAVNPDRFRGKTTGIVISGGNLDSKILRKICGN